MAAIDERNVVSVRNRILENELAGVVRYTHYSFLVFGFGRIPIVSWLREQADESLLQRSRSENGSRSARIERPRRTSRRSRHWRKRS